jgi:hypothetical protein
MTWADPQWVAFCALLEEAWPGEFDDHSRTAWRVLLDPLDPAAAVEGLRRLLLEGHRFRPSVSEVLAAAGHDPQWGEKRRADLERAWNEHVETWDGREVAVLASGERRGLQQFDPLAALGRAGLTPRPELEETTSS